MEDLNEVILDYDNEFSRIQQGIELTRSRRKKKSISNEQHHAKCKEKLINGSYTPFEFLQGMIRSLESVINDSELPETYDESESDDEPEHTHQNPVA